MATESEQTLNDPSDLDIIVSSDEHLSEKAEEFVPYIDEEKYGGIKRIIKQAEDPWRELFSITWPLPAFSNTDMASDPSGAGNVMEKGENKLDTKLLRMDKFDIDYGIINPTLMLSLSTVNNTQAAAALANGYNNWLFQEFISQTDRLYMCVVVAPQDPDAAVEEIERYADKDGVVGVQLGGTGHKIPVSHEFWDPIYAAAEEHDLPVTFHSTLNATGHGFPEQHRWHELFAEDKVISHPFSQMWNVMKLVYEGIPQKYPDLTFVIQESGIGWIPYWKMRLDRFHLGLGQEMPMLDKLPSKVIDDRFYFMTQPVGHSGREPKHIAWMTEMAGPENLMFSADIPHSDFDAPKELFDPIKPHFDDETIRDLMGQTAIDVFDLDIPTDK